MKKSDKIISIYDKYMLCHSKTLMFQDETRM